MLFLILLLVIAAVLSADAIRRAINDGPRLQPPPRSHADDPDFLAPWARE